MESLSRRDALQIIQSIREGTPPPARLIHHLHVGRQRWLEGMAWYLDAAKCVDLSAVRFIVGEYGSGKTHFLRMTARMALERRFITCEVTLSREIRLDRFDTVWRAMMSNLATPDLEGEPEGIEAILNRWCEQAVESSERLVQMLSELDQIQQLDPDFRKAMRGYLRAYVQDGDRDNYLQWLKGNPARLPGVRARIDRASARAMLRSLIHFFKYLGYSGLVLFLDELELIRDQNQKVRDANYDVLRQFIDDADNLRSFLLLCSVTPVMVEDNQRGFPSYPPLWQRIRPIIGGVEGDYRAITINLDSLAAQLTDDDLLEMAKRLRKIHSVAMAWDAEKVMPDDFLKKLVDAVQKETTEFSHPRLIVQSTISILEAKNQNPERELMDLLPESIRQAIEISHQQERLRHRVWEG